MLSSIKLKNFKSFKNLDSLDIKPITILCGVNSCGKSSILQSLLLLKQTKESRNPNQSLLFNGKYVHLGDIENIVYGKNKDNELALCYEYEFSTKQFFRNRKQKHGTIPISFFFRYLLSEESRKMKKHRLKLNIVFKLSNENKGYIRTADIQQYHISIESTNESGNTIPGAIISIHKKECDYSLKWEKIPEPHERDNRLKSGNTDGLFIDFENLFPLIEIKNRSDEDSFEKLPYEIRNFLRASDDFIISTNEGISYVGPLREEPSRRYIYENEVLEIGVKGENAAYIYQTEQEYAIKDHYFFDESNKNNFSKQDDISLKNALSKWLELMNIKGFKPNYQSEIIRLNMTSNSSPNTDVNIADVGFGVSQIFPILLEGLRIQKNNTLLLEQPEIHLHPNLQMQMADYFISLALSDKNVIVETHSDHIINRLVRRIIEDETYDLKNKIAIYFVSNSDEGAVVENVIVDDQKGILNWPDGFFDQTASEQEKIMMAGINKRKKARNKE